MLESANTTQNMTSGIDVKSVLTANNSQKILILRLLCLESDSESNSKIIENFLSFPTTTYTPRYDKRSRSYDFQTSMRLLYSCAERFEQSAKPELLTPKPIQSQETCNLRIVDNFLSFLMSSHMTYLVKWSQGYQNPKTARKCRFQQKAGNRFGVGARYELVPELSYMNNLFRNEVWLTILSDGAEFQAAHASVQFYPFG
jgi:hypothetical protein